MIGVALSVLTPVIDIFPWSVFILFTLGLPFIYELVRNQFRLKFGRKGSFLQIWFLISVTGLTVATLLSLASGTHLGQHFNYFFRVLIIFYVSMCSIQGIVSSNDEQKLMSKYANFLFYLVLGSAVFEYSMKFLNFNSLLYLYKARQDLGGIDTVHYNRFSGFWSFPGDVSAVIVLTMALLVQCDLKFRTLKFSILLTLLLLTQSKAGFLLLIVWLILKIISEFNFKNTVIFLVFCSVALVGVVQTNLISYFTYLKKFIDNFEHYIGASKRAQEIFGYLDATYLEQIVGLTTPFDMYESELLGSLGRIGLFGSFWILFLCLSILYFLGSSKNYKNLWSFLLAFCLCYLLISAGLSRFKILIPFTFVFWILIFVDKPVHQKLRDWVTVRNKIP